MNEQQSKEDTMIKKVIILFLVTAFLNFMITPEFAFAQGSFPQIDAVPDKSTMLIGGLIVVGVIVLAVLLISHAKRSKDEQPKDQEHDTKMSSELNLDNQPLTQKSYETNYDDQLITQSGQLVLLKW
jgi:Ca2+/H+ antiporter